MKNIYLVILTITLVFIGHRSVAQIVGTNLFLQGNYVEVGMNKNGSFGACTSAGAIPSSYHPHLLTPIPSSSMALGEVYDYGHDGWTVGSPAYMGDYTYAGSPFEGWEIQVGAGRVQAFQNCSGGMSASYGTLTVSGTNSGYSSTGTAAIGTWTGSGMGGQLQIKMETEVGINSSAVVMKVTLRNTGTTPLADVYYFRSCDPDPDATWSGGASATTNRIIYQNDSGRSMVEATGALGYSISLAALDSRAKALVYTSWYISSTVDLSTFFTGTYGTPGTSVLYTSGACLPTPCTAADIAIGLAFNLGTIAAGDSVEFKYAYLFDGLPGFSTVFPFPCSGTPYAGTPAASAPVACSSTVDTISLPSATVGTGLTYQWQSSPDSMSWSSIGGATNNTYSFTGLATTTYYRCILTCSAAGIPDTSAGVKVTASVICPCVFVPGNAISNLDTACSADTLHLADTGYSTTTALTFQWQSSPDSVTWTNIPTATSATHALTGMTTTTYYRCEVTCTTSGTTQYTNGKKIRSVTMCTCAGTPIVGTATASTGVCSSCTVTLDVPTLSPMGGYSYQWQKSHTASGPWTNITGATTIAYNYTPDGPYFYRLKVSCSASGLSGYSASIYVGYDFHIIADTIGHFSDTTCYGTRAFVEINGISASPTLSVHSYWGDGTDTVENVVNSMSTSYVNPPHAYSTPGWYTLKHVLLLGSAPIDSVITSYEYRPCTIIPIRLYEDTNGNCIKDPSELYNSIPVGIVVDSAGVVLDTITATSGIYCEAYGPAGTVYTFSMLSAGWVATCPSGGTLSYTLPAGPTTTAPQYIGLSCATSSSVDLSVVPLWLHSTPTGQTGIIQVRNEYCNPTNAHLSMMYSYKYTGVPTTYADISPAGSYTVTTHPYVLWNTTPISNAYSPSYTYIANAGAPLTVGDTVLEEYTVNTVGTTDIDMSNNTVIRIDTVRGALDPNSIEVLPSGCFDFDTTFMFYVHFENTGNDTAYNVHVLDTLSDNLDASTLRAVASSANQMLMGTYSAAGHTVVRFDFPNIKLLDSSWHGQNDAAFVYSVRNKPGMATGGTIDSRVGIYFDYNDVVMTNTVQVVRGCPTTGTHELSIPQTRVYPSPTDNYVYVVSEQVITNVSITDATGRQILTQPNANKTATINVQQLPSGVYLLTLYHGDSKEVKRFVKQ